VGYSTGGYMTKTPKNGTIRITCKGAANVPYHTILNFQGALKELSDENYARLENEILVYGFNSPIDVWKNGNKLFNLDGHQRILVLMGLENKGYKIPDIPINYIIAKNMKEAKHILLTRISQYGKVTPRGIYDYLKEAQITIDSAKESFSIPGVDLDSIKAEFFVDKDKEEKDKIEDDVILKVKSRCKLGELWLLGDHRLLCGDGTNIDHINRLMNGEKTDMVFTDPPYGVGYKYHSHNDNKTKEEHAQFLKDLIILALSLSKKFILTPGCNNLDAVLRNSEPSHVGCWTKINAMSSGRVTHFWTWEPIFFWGKWKRKRGNDVFNFPVGNQPDTGDHTCPKPIALWQDIIENFSEKKEKILDLYGGSGSTLIACEKTDRICFMMEIDPHYCDVIINRWEKYSGQKARKVETKLKKAVKKKSKHR